MDASVCHGFMKARCSVRGIVCLETIAVFLDMSKVISPYILYLRGHSDTPKR